MRLLTTLSILGTVAAITSFSNSPKLKITSTSFANNGSIPSKYSCEGEEVSPPLLISDIPSGTKSLAIILHDPDAPREGGFTHWVVWNIDPGNNNIPENFKGAQQGLNGAGQPGYKGCALHPELTIIILWCMRSIQNWISIKKRIRLAWKKVCRDIFLPRVILWVYIKKPNNKAHTSASSV